MPSSNIVLTNVRIFDGSQLTEPTSIAFNGGVIVPPDALPGTETVDCGGATLLPGLFDAHVHLLFPDDLVKLAAHGVTTALDMACWPPERVDSFRGHTPDIRSAGTPAIGGGGNHARMPGMPHDAILSNPGQAEHFVAQRVAEGADYIKVVIEGDLLSQATIDAVVTAGKARGRLTVAHASSVDAYRRAVQANADVITHAPRDGVLDTDIVAQMVQQQQVVVPTLAMMEAVIKGLAPAGQDYAFSRDSVTALHAAGVPILAGTDAFSGPAPLPNPVSHGSSIHRELELLVEAGLSEAAALRSATDLVAQQFNLTDRGALTPGLRADAILVDGDPLADIRATRNIRRIWASGVSVTSN
ncbi:amidohydrolase family protein [Streptomyces sp. NPDC056296]|uniref:amidohydrolase family protein n=1 Tax=Streptomyces sp. NPDC056296 TaxID=3345775 RepID=UPI0035DF675B